ncbi:nucleotidyltransferase domain-containing protein [Candidatus Uhrbacteria bacterium]|nr:nucleotidyltransferase domain-containing protein [Candidatus Uhrbacteria bacterium]
MRLEHYDVEKLKRELLGLIGTYVDLRTHRVFFFGSRVADNAFERSDIDVGIEGPEAIPDVTMWAIGEAVQSIPTFYKIDVVDFHAVSQEFRTVALQHVESFNEPVAI